MHRLLIVIRQVSTQIHANTHCRRQGVNCYSTYQCTTTPQGDNINREIEYFELFCNPNAYPTIYEARAVLHLRTKDGLKIATEAKLTGLRADVDAFLAAHH